MIIRRSINKEEVKDMPKAVFPGQIHVVQTPQEAERAVAYLKKCSILGIDSETRPSFTKGQSHKVALLQISSEEHCFHSGQKPSKDICHPFRRKDFKEPAPVQLGSRCADTVPTTIRSYRRMGLPEHIQPAAGAEAYR